ncbi:MAG: hypothetical protein A2Y56_14730 [Candidatus Aminicenantes bacterium RBG_13_63_10]|nr:MAG: hypothetical protein A2Y56_14730 [Candidatus Aminicenantes bacterium RBG_13_63_10]
MNKIAAIALLAAGLTLPVLGLDDERQSLFWENRVLEAELELARTNASYFVIDLAQKVIVLKAKGLVLRAWKVEDARFRQRAWPIRTVSVLKKKALSVPTRKTIDPKKAEEIGSYEPDALESKDMPADYYLYFGDDVVLHVSSRKKSFVSFILMWELSFQLAAYEAARSFWEAAFHPRAGIIQARLENEAESRTLCWSLTNGMKGLIIMKKA